MDKFLSDDFVAEAHRLLRHPPDTRHERAYFDYRRDPGGMSSREVAAVMGLSCERVRQIQEIALIKAGVWCAVRGLTLDDVLP